MREKLKRHGRTGAQLARLVADGALWWALMRDVGTLKERVARIEARVAPAAAVAVKDKEAPHGVQPVQ